MLVILYGLGVRILLDNWETIQQSIDPLQSQHLLVEQIGNKFLVAHSPMSPQLKLMEPYGLGEPMAQDI